MRSRYSATSLTRCKGSDLGLTFRAQNPHGQTRPLRIAVPRLGEAVKLCPLYVSMQAIQDQLRLTYRSGTLDLDYAVGVERIPCHFGGSRPIFVRARVVDGRRCDRRVGKLYKKGTANTHAAGAVDVWPRRCHSSSSS